MSAPEVNVPLLRKAVEWAEAEAARGKDGLWDQSWYVTEKSCGTVYCIAGWTVAQSGEDPNECNAAEDAAAALGIPRWRGESGHLFDGDNTIEDVRRIAESLAGERL